MTNLKKILKDKDKLKKKNKKQSFIIIPCCLLDTMTHNIISESGKTT